VLVDAGCSAVADRLATSRLINVFGGGPFGRCKPYHRDRGPYRRPISESGTVCPSFPQPRWKTHNIGRSSSVIR
jgi:hypothetical protein